MPIDYRNKALLYHLTSLDNLPSILANGLQSRACLEAAAFADVAVHKIVEGRKVLKLEEYVPFHFFAPTPFDYAVQRPRATESFVLLTVRRTYAESNEWMIIPSHPLSQEAPELMSYGDGFNAINWDLMGLKQEGVTFSTDRAYRQACMAECLSPDTVPASAFHSIFVKTEEDKRSVEVLLSSADVSPYVNLNVKMFPKDVE